MKCPYHFWIQDSCEKRLESWIIINRRWGDKHYQQVLISKHCTSKTIYNQTSCTRNFNSVSINVDMSPQVTTCITLKLFLTGKISSTLLSPHFSSMPLWNPPPIPKGAILPTLGTTGLTHANIVKHIKQEETNNWQTLKTWIISNLPNFYWCHLHFLLNYFLYLLSIKTSFSIYSPSHYIP